MRFPEILLHGVMQTIKHQLVSVCYFFQQDSHPPHSLILGTNIKEFLVVFSQNTPTYYHIDKEKILIEILVTHPVTCSRIPNPTSFTHSFQRYFLSMCHGLYRYVSYGFYKNCRAQTLAVDMSYIKLLKQSFYSGRVT